MRSRYPERGSSFEYYMWLFTRLSGVLMLFLGAFGIVYAILAGGRTALRWRPSIAGLFSPPIGTYRTAISRMSFPIGSILKAARSGQNIRLGDGSAKFGHVFVANVVHAHLLAAGALDAPAAGQAYFIGDHPAGNFFDFFTPYLAAFGFPPAKARFPYRVAYMLAILMETAARLGIGPSTPTLTRYVVASTCVDLYFSHDKAARELGYQPMVSLERARTETLTWLKSDQK